MICFAGRIGVHGRHGINENLVIFIKHQPHSPMENQTQAQVMSTKDWMITLLIVSIPLVGFIMLFVWAFGSGENPNKSNFSKAALIWTAIWCVLAILFYGSLAAILFSAGRGYDA